MKYIKKSKGLNTKAKTILLSQKLRGEKLMTKKGKDIFEVFFRRKPAMILVALRKSAKSRYGSVLAKA